MEEITEQDPILLALQAEFDLIAAPEQKMEHWLPNWYLGKVNDIDAARKRVKEQAKVMIAQLDNAEKYLAYRWGQEFQACVDDDIAKQKSKKRSIDYLQGRAGYRKGRDSLLVNDEDQAIEWAETHCPEAVVTSKRLVKTPLLDMVKEHGIIPDGCDYQESKDNFYPAVYQLRLEQE